MIYDFYENFPDLYPLPRKSILFPDREIFGHYWEFEDYLIEGEKGRGLVLQGFLISDESDLSHFEGVFNQAIRITSINSIIGNTVPVEDLLLMNDPQWIDVYKMNVTLEIKKAFDLRFELRDGFISELKSSLKESKVWLATNQHWSTPVQKDLENFWNEGIKIMTFPDQFSVMKRKDVWEEVDFLGPIEFNKEMAWGEFAFRHPSYVKYIEEEIRQNLDLNFLDQCHGFGLI